MIDIIIIVTIIIVINIDNFDFMNDIYVIHR